MDPLHQLTLSEIVIKYPFSANIFEKYRLDFCCGGKKTLSSACRENGLEIDPIENELKQVFAANLIRKDKIEFHDMGLDLLIDYIESNHHAYVRNSMPVILAHLEKVVKAHGANHPEMSEILNHFEEVAEEMTLHMQKEEKLLFPYIRQIDAVKKENTPLVPPPFTTVQNPISVMEFEHERAGKTMEKIRILSAQFQPPADACTTYRLCLAELDEFERDLHKHVHLENNILFPKALKTENELIYNN